MKYGKLKFIADHGDGETREIEFHISQRDTDLAVSISINGEQPMWLGGQQSLKMLKDFIDPWMATQNEH